MSIESYARPRGLYRSRHGMIFGVCAGLAERLDVSVFWTRMIVTATFLMTGFWPVGALYLLAAMLLKPAPVLPLGSREEAILYRSCAASPRHGLERVKDTFESLDQRLQRLESAVTSREYEWEQRLYRG